MTSQSIYKVVYDSDNVVFSLFLDFRKQFDCVNDKILLSKLNTYGIRGVTLYWFGSYLTNREQYVCINNVNSNPQIIQCGVPQEPTLNVNFPIIKIGNNKIIESSVSKFLHIHLDKN